MALTWTRETVADITTAVSGWTYQQAYNYFGVLAKDPSHTAYSNTSPYTNFALDMLNNAVNIITAYAPDRIEVISTTTEADTPLYAIPDFVASTAHIKMVKYDGNKIDRVYPASVIAAEISNLDDDSLDSTGTPVRWLQQGDRLVRLVPYPPASKTLKIYAYTQPTAATALTGLMPIPGYMRTAPAYYCAAEAWAIAQNYELSSLYSKKFWHLVNKKVEQNVDSLEASDIPIPNMDEMSPDFSET